MGALLENRPRANIAPLGGVFRCDYFQTAYVTNDLERACEVFAERYGVSAWHSLDNSFQNGSRMSIRLAWIGGHNLEIIEAHGPGMEFYNDRLPEGEFAIRHHHLGYLLPDEQAWQDFETEIETRGWNVALADDLTGFLKVKYLDAPELGHYMEFFLLDAGGIAMFEAVPAS
jgi:extradiol dioxygenase family protein